MGILDPKPPTRAELSATYVPKWKANTAYLAGDKVLSPAGDVVSAKVNFTSGAAYSAANWDLSASVAGKLDKTEASSTYAKPTANSVVLFGTSLENQNGPGSDTLDPVGGAALKARGWFHWCNAFTGDKLKLVYNAGIGGNTYAQMLARINTDVLAYDSAWVFIGGPVNDIMQDRTTAAIIADATAILDALNGRRILLLTAGPTSSYNTTARKTVASEINAWITSLPRTRRNVTVADAWATLADRATGAAATGMTSAGDAIHWSVAGALRVGKAAAAAISPFLASVPKKASHNADPKSVIANPEFLTNGSGWSVYGGTIVYGAAEDYFGNKATLTISANTANDERAINFVENISGARFAAGDVIQASVKIKWSGLVPLGIATKCCPVVVLRQRQTDGAFPSESEAATFTSSSGEMVVPVGYPTSGEIVVTTPRLTIRSTTSPIDRLYVYLGWAGAADVVVEFSELAVLKV